MTGKQTGPPIVLETDRSVFHRFHPSGFLKKKTAYRERLFSIIPDACRLKAEDLAYAENVSRVPDILRIKRSGMAFSICMTASLPVQWVGMT